MVRVIQYLRSLILGSLLILVVSPAYSEGFSVLENTVIALIDKKMDDFHDAADKGDKLRYLKHFSNDSVFMGTDDWERWPYALFSKYVDKNFKDGKGWSYKPIKRYTHLNSEKSFAWVDEIVVSEKWGRFRGNAVLENTDQGWKLKHYSLTKLVPNESWVEVSNITQKAYKARTVDVGAKPPAAN